MPYDPTIEDHADLFYQQVEGEPLPSVGDGKTYSRALGWQSPEGNFYGQERWVRDWPVGVVWDGEDYRAIEVDGEADSESELPIPGEINPRTGLPYGPRQHFEVWSIPRLNWPPVDLEVWDGRDREYYFWDSTLEAWQLIEWFYDVDGEENLRRPGLKVGAAHVLWYYDIKVMWNGLAWVRLSHEMLDLGENDYLHLTDGFMDGYTNYQTNTNGAIQFLQSQQAEARLEFISKTNLGLLSSVPGKTGALWVNNELLLTEDVSNVENTDSVLQYSNGTITTDTIDPNTEYYVYCGNSDFSACSSGLFLSNTPDINGRLGDEEPGLNARIVGIVETDSAGYFIREIDMSYIGKRVEFSQTYWEYSDYQLQFVDQDNLAFNRIDGTHGLFYVNGQLLYLGTGRDLSREAYRIEWGDGPIVDTTDISTETAYQIYIANDSVEFNFNSDDPETGLPYEEGHGSYIWQLDFRRQMFLSTQPHDHRVFNQEYPGYYARHIGQVQTDENGYFKYAADISLIRQPTLNPTSLDGLAECVIQDISTSEFRITRKKGTTGVVYVGGRPVQTYDVDNPLAHSVKTSDALYTYTESNISSPLSGSGLNIENKCGYSIYLYLANDIPAWGGVKAFCSLLPPTGGYLSTNWPGNNARWIATLKLAPNGLGAEKVTNGNFTSDASSWNLNAGWAYSSDNKNVQHTPGSTGDLWQSCGLESGKLYSISFTVSGRTAGTLSPEAFTTRGDSIATNTSVTQYLIPSGNGNIELWPDSTFNGAVDNVSVKEVITGHFSGTYVADSVSGVSAQIDDAVISNSTTYSSNKIEQIRQQLLTKINVSLGLNSALSTGYNLILEYINSSTIRVKSLSGDVEVIFPSLEIVTISTTGVSATVSGSTNTLYYVYLSSVGVVEIMTAAPTDVYSGVSYKGDSYVLIGYLSFTTTNNMAGIWNVYSFWNEPTRAFTFNNSYGGSLTYANDSFYAYLVAPQAIHNINPIYTNLLGLLIPEGGNGSLSFTEIAAGESFFMIRGDAGGEIGRSTSSGGNLNEGSTTFTGSQTAPYGVGCRYITSNYTVSALIKSISYGVYYSINTCSIGSTMDVFGTFGASCSGATHLSFGPHPYLYSAISSVGKTVITRTGNV